MSSVKNINTQNSLGAHLRTGQLGRFIPEPKSNLGLNFRSILSGVGSVVGAGVSSVTGIDPSYQALIERQIKVQQQMQLVSMHSNIEKSKHETKMSAVRNLRAA